MNEKPRIKIIIVPNLRKAYIKASKILENSIFECLFINFPKIVEKLFILLLNGHINYEEFILKIKDFNLPHISSKSWLYLYEPLIKTIYSLKQRNFKIFCYINDEDYFKSINYSINSIALLLRTSIMNKINKEKWLKQLFEEINFDNELNKKILNTIENEVIKYNSSICISDFNGCFLEEKLNEKFEVELIYSIVPYIFTSLEILKRKLILKEKLNNDEIEKLIFQQIDYIKNYILLSDNLDEAYYKWVSKKLLEYINCKCFLT
ncbi:MAG: hypothetical protein QXY18_01375 [Nitrososphaerota archaeon]